MHPGYYSTKYGERHFKDRLVKVQHHYSHVLSCMIENEIPEDSEVIGFAFDGTGYGADKTIWGGEVLIASYKGFERVYHLRPYKLPGGDRAIKEPYRIAFSLLYETIGDRVKEIDFIPLTREEKSFYINMIKRNINSPVTSSMGRLFDGIASIINLKHGISYHAQAAIALEQAALGSGETGAYSFTIDKNSIDFRSLIEQILNDVTSEKTKETIARKFHNTLINIIVNISESINNERGISTVALSGGVFQNSILLENAFNKLKEKGFVPIIHQLVPPNDGGISLGQAVYGQFI
jgi:hydrogenase maturation protein HypF